MTKLITLSLIVIFSFLIYEAQGGSETNNSIFGFLLSDKEPISKKQTKKILNTLLPESAWKEHGFNISGPSKSKSYLVDYGSSGKILNLDRRLSDKDNTFSIHIERPVSTLLRHKIMIGTDKNKWNIIKKETTHPINKPFYRVYLLQFGRSNLFQGIVFMDGVWIVLQWSGNPNNENINNLKKITWLIANNLKKNYEKLILPLAKELDHGGPVLTRPDLPDPDLI